jgi:glycosyltransferase involved in cell wall biosynthesis
MIVRVAILAHNAQGGDALGNQVAEKLAFFLDRGADIRVLLESEQRLHAAVRSQCRILSGAKLRKDCWEFLSSADLILVEYGQYYRLLEWLPLLAGGKPRLLFDYHGVTPPEFWDGPNREALEKGTRRRGLVWCCDAALVHSRFTGEELRGQTAFPSERVSVLDYPVDTRRFRPGNPRRHLSAPLGLRDISLLLFVGRLAPNKRVGVLIEALDRLRARKPPIHLAIIGDCTDVYGIEALRCRGLADELRLADRVHFLGRVGDELLLDAYRSADLFVMPSRHEGFCIPVIEAMACGLPVIAARAAALPETVGDAGLTFTPDDPDDLARQVQQVLECGNGNGGLADEMRRRGLRRAATHDGSLWRERFGQMVEDLLHRPPREKRDLFEVRPRTSRRTVAVGSESLLVPVRVINQGTHAALTEGPGSVQLRSWVADEQGQRCRLPPFDTPLPELLAPGQEVAAMIRVPVPARVGVYKVSFFAVPSSPPLRSAPTEDRPALCSEKSAFQLIVEPAPAGVENRYFASSLQAIHRALAEAERRQQLPTHYLDVTGGLLAKFKRWIKGKLLGNFKQAYVDVVSRQQSAFNRQTLAALQELAECCMWFDQALGERDTGETSQKADLASLVRHLSDDLAEARRRLVALETRLNHLEERREVVGWWGGGKEA